MTTGSAAGFATTGIDNHPGHPDQKSHGRRRKAAPATGAAAHDAVPIGLDREDSDLSLIEHAALYGYRQGEYTNVNDGLRNPPADPTSSRRIETIDAVMERSRLTAPIQVERGVADGQRVFGDAWGGDMTGGTFTEPAYMSTTTDSHLAAGSFADPGSGRGARIIVTVPAGTGAIDLGHGRGESEIMLQRGTSWRITSDTTTRRDGRVIEMEMTDG